MLSKFIPVSCLALWLFGCQSTQQESTEMKSLIVAHRGASFEAPENTVASAQLAWQQNADAVEVDIHTSKDQRIMVIHDKNTKRTCGADMLVKETLADSLRALEAGSWKDVKYEGEPLPFLEEVIETIPAGKKLYVEIKCEKTVVPLLKEMLAQHPKKEQILFIAFDYETIVATKEAFPENKAYWLSSKLPEDYKSLFEKVKKDKLDGVDLSHKVIDAEVVKTAGELGLEVHTWTVNDLERANELQTIGVKSITTDKPGEILGGLQ
ncbi:glycerophosphodiester phosphodiesterase family protein [Rapidithrix thailandica]|uniref:Glycerophosphodiester phosphodiesterase family protein n=1 Tax=Rapidithrix thailandica TaxID=413964 RepID=A0AAW9SHI4_9BACT